jgi:hypothetical protein
VLFGCCSVQCLEPVGVVCCALFHCPAFIAAATWPAIFLSIRRPSSIEVIRLS